MLSFFVYLIIFLVPGLFAALVYNFISCNRMECSKTVILGLIFDLLILGINLAGLSFAKGICTFQKFQSYLSCLSFTSKYILLSIVVGMVLAVLAWLLLLLFSFCKKHCYHHNKNCK